jgi:hypothetical protein
VDLVAPENWIGLDAGALITATMSASTMPSPAVHSTTWRQSG